VFNLGTNSGASCSPGLREKVGAVLEASGQSTVVDGRFKGGWITRAYGRPGEGVEAVQLELACRAYMLEPEHPGPENWPTPVDQKRAQPTRAIIKRVLEAILARVSE
jgi:N-formylglutamate deformylase